MSVQAKLIGRGTEALGRGRLAEAEEHLEAAIALGPKPYRRTAKALHLLAQTLELSPSKARRRLEALSAARRSGSATPILAGC